MATRHEYVDVCPECHAVYRGYKEATVQNQAENCKTRCTPVDESEAPDLKTALENARKELGDW